MTENIHNTGPSAHTAQGWMNSLTEFAVKVTELEVKAALLTIALEARMQHPEAAYVVLDDSDQGPWQWVETVVDAEGNDLVGQDGYDEDSGASSHLYDNVSDVWRAFCKKHNPDAGWPGARAHWWVDIDLVLKHIHPHPVLELLHSRDSDGPCSMDVWVAGESYTYGNVVDFDPGRGWEKVAWDAMVEGELSLPMSEKFRGAVQATFDGDSEFIDGEEDDDS